MFYFDLTFFDFFVQKPKLQNFYNRPKIDFKSKRLGNENFITGSKKTLYIRLKIDLTNF